MKNVLWEGLRATGGEEVGCFARKVRSYNSELGSAKEEGSS
jgi:hypothetical protein